jgi:hypothetical protein
VKSIAKFSNLEYISSLPFLLSSDTEFSSTIAKLIKLMADYLFQDCYFGAGDLRGAGSQIESASWKSLLLTLL